VLPRCKFPLPLSLALLASWTSVSAAQRPRGGDQALEIDDLAGPAPEVVAVPARPIVPALPSFELPRTAPGLVSARELQVLGKRKLGAEVKVAGYVTWIYDCAAALAARNPKAKRAAIQKAIDDDPTKCEVPKLALGDARGAAREGSISVVEVPRPPNKIERRRLPKDALARWPAVPKVAVGDYVVVTGQWTTRAPRGDSDSDGLLVYGALAPATPPSAADGGGGQVAEAEPALVVVTQAPLRKRVAAPVRAASINQLGQCHRFATARDFEAALRACRTATTTWEGNHLAWYTLSSTHMALGQWPEARAAVGRAVALRPDLAMYQLYLGVALYEEAQRAAPASADAQLAAREALRRAAQLNPSLWRAHFYLARVYDDLGDARRAAEQFAATIEVNPTYRYAYLSIVQLLRRWSALDAALGFAQLGATHVEGADAADLWIELGLLSEARHTDAPALDAYGRALALRPGDVRAQLQRGQLLYRTGDLAGARRDLEGTLASTEPQILAARPFVLELLAKIAAQQR
jgi:tetratricopeptide (TPR) repeat protein